MSKFIEKLEKVGQHQPTPIGFGAARRDSPAPQIMLVGQVTSSQLSRDSGLADASVDAFLVSLDSDGDRALDSAASALEGKLWGVRSNGFRAEQVSALKEKGCDFVVFDAESTDAALLNDEDLGKIIALPSEFNEETARAVHDLAIDAALFSPQTSLLPLTVQKLIEVQKVRGLVGKPFVMLAPVELGQGELEAFRNMDVTGLVVEMPSVDTANKLKDAIASLPRPRPRRTRSDIIPQAPYGFQPPNRQRREEEDDEDDF